MRSILDALQEGRLIELPTDKKEDAIKMLGAVIEAVPDVPPGTDMVGEVLKREQQMNTLIGQGWACPHARFSGQGGLVCAIGWLPVGIDYGVPNSQPVRIMVMYYIPEFAKNAYLKEVSGLAKALQAPGESSLQAIAKATSLDAVRDILLDLATKALETVKPDAQARMIRLEARIAEAAAAGPTLPFGLSADRLTSLWIVGNGSERPLVLSQDENLVAALEQTAGLSDLLRNQNAFQAGEFVLLVRQNTAFRHDRVLYDCIAVRQPTPPLPAVPSSRQLIPADTITGGRPKALIR